MRIFSVLLSLITLLGTVTAQAEIRLAFFVYRDARGEVIQFEPGGRFGHVAVAVPGGWLHSYPYKGVSIEPSLETIGKEYELVTREDLPDLEAAEIEKVLGLPYDSNFVWDDPSSTYCSKLVGKLLGLDPEPMDFTTPYWEGREPLPQGELGLSPDDLYQRLALSDDRCYI